LDSARLLNLDDRIGSLDEGKAADLLVLDGDPMADIAILRMQERIRRVVLNGQTVLDRDVSRVLIGTGFSVSHDITL
jgi:imidazolonepropionase-like amidohydrolase